MNWINIKDKLPKVDEWVIITDGSDVKMGRYLGISKRLFSGESFYNFKYCDCCYDFHRSDITYWANPDDLPK